MKLLPQAITKAKSMESDADAEEEEDAEKSDAEEASGQPTSDPS